MCIRDRINAAADLLVVDEAHNLDDKARSATTERFGQGMLFGMIKNAFYELRSFDPVSYTHLDVYKRQHQGFCLFP